MAEQPPIRVFIVDDVVETRENLKKILAFEPRIRIVGEAANGREALQKAPQADPDVIIMDIHLPDMNGLEVTEHLVKVLPAAQIVVLTVQGDMEYMRRAMMAGARDFLTKPPAIDELLEAVRRAGALAHEERSKLAVAQEAVTVSRAGIAPGAAQGRVITVLGAKGGVGKTFITANLAAALHAPETIVAAVDGKWGLGDLVVLFNLHPTRTWQDVVPPQDVELLRAALHTHESTGIMVLPAPTRWEAGTVERAQAFGEILHTLRALADYVVVDTAHPLDDLSLHAISHSDLVLIVFEQDLISVRNVRLLMEMFGGDLPPQRRMLVLNRVMKKKGVSPERLEEFFKERIFMIPEDTTVPVSINQGRLLVVFSRSAQAARGVLLLARHVRERLLQAVQA